MKTGLYIVIDPAKNKKEILKQLAKIKEKAIAAVQIWDNPDVSELKGSLINEIIGLFKGKVPILINNKWELLQNYNFDGIHFDKIPSDLKEIEAKIRHPFIKGLTLNNDLDILKKAVDLSFDYFSFCALFPSKTVDDCEIVHPDTIKKCRKLTTMPIYLSGGITPNKVKELKNYSFQGIAVVSGIMDAENPSEAFDNYQVELNKIKLCN